MQFALPFLAMPPPDTSTVEAETQLSQEILAQLLPLAQEHRQMDAAAIVKLMSTLRLFEVR